MFLPTADAASSDFPSDAVIEGSIVDFSDSGPERQAFAVVDVGQGQRMVVPVDRLKLVAPASGDSES